MPSPLLERKKKDGEVNSPLHAASEEGGADADFGGALFDGHFEVVGHAHGQNRERQPEFCFQLVAQLAQTAEIVTDGVGEGWKSRGYLGRAKARPYRLEERRDAHQASEFEMREGGYFFGEFGERGDFH